MCRRCCRNNHIETSWFQSITIQPTTPTRCVAQRSVLLKSNFLCSVTAPQYLHSTWEVCRFNPSRLNPDVSLPDKLQGQLQKVLCIPSVVCTDRSTNCAHCTVSLELATADSAHFKRTFSHGIFSCTRTRCTRDKQAE